MQSYIKYFEIAAALAAIVNWKYIRRDAFIKHLAYLVFFIAAAELAGFVIKHYKLPNAPFYNFIVNPGIFILYALAFYMGFTNRRNRLFAIYGAYITILIWGATVYLVNANKMLNVYGYIAGAIFVALLAILKILELVKQDQHPNYLKSPLIFLLLAILFFYLITVPHYSISFYMFLKKIKGSSITFLLYIHAIFNYLLYTCFFLTFLLWGRSKQKY